MVQLHASMPSNPNPSGFVLSGWIIFASIVSIVASIFDFGDPAHRRRYAYRPYTLVMKGRGVA